MNILIAGLAKTGTTILFSRVLHSLPTPPATFFEPREAAAFANIFATGQTQDTLTKALIGHIAASDPFVSRFDRTILIVRDPRDQFVSEMLYEFFAFQRSGNAPGFEAARELLARKVEHPLALSAAELFSAIRELATGILPKTPPIRLLRGKYQKLQAFRALSPCVVRYEDIVDNNLQDVADYLGLPELRTAEVDSSLRRVSRSNSYGEWRQWLREDDVTQIDNELGDMMRELGYAAEPASPSPEISRETSIDYIEQFRPA